MEFLRTQSRYVGDQLRGMSTSQRIAVGLLLVLLLGGMWQMMRWAGEPAWTPLLDQALSAEEIQRVRGELTLAGIKTKVEGDRVLIQGGTEARQRSQAVLAQRGAMPQDTSPGYEELIKNSSSFISNLEQDWRHDRGLETEISAVLRRFGGIREARVLLDKPKKRGVGRAKSGARASVNVTLAGGTVLDQQRVDAIANFVAGAVRDLAVRDVKITDGSRFYRPSDPQEGVASNLLKKQRDHEEHYTKMIYDQFRHIRGLVANVRVKLRDTDERVENRELGQPAPSEETEEIEETKSAASATGPGVRPNRSAAITNGGSGNTSNRSKTVTKFSENRSTKLTRISRPAGFETQLAASVNVPHSYFEQVLRKQLGLGEEESVQTSQVDDVAKIELKKIHDQIKTLLQVEDDKQVTVSSYYDVSGSVAGAVAAAADPAGYLALVTRYGPQAGLVVLALFSLFAVFRMAGKAQASLAAPQGTGRGGAPASAGEAAELAALGGGPLPVGEAEGMSSAMVGHEVDEGLVRTQQIVEQIGQLVKEDPDSAAGIVQSWLQDEH
ncbi:MAG: hypothetical protein ACE5E1_02305 [Phycisphaerae bacterium]